TDRAKHLRASRAASYRAHHACHNAVPYFIGVWDTVRALGLPGVSRFVPWRHAFHDATLHPDVQHAPHALALDDDRGTFLPELVQCEDHVERRFLEPSVPSVRGEGPYRPIPLARHPAFVKYYEVIAAQHQGRWQRLGMLASRWKVAPPVGRARQ